MPVALGSGRAAAHVLAKPTGPVCNLDCDYCFFLAKESMYPGDRFRMADELLEQYVRQMLEMHAGASEVTLAWQGGEPTLMGVDFFRRSVELARRHARPGQRVRHTLQTNGTLLTDEWCELLAGADFLVGISIDGPPELHDRYRLDKRRRPTSERVLRGLRLLQEHRVEHNVLCTVHAGNQDRPLDVYRYFRDELDQRFVQFIPIVEPTGEPGEVTDRSVAPAAWGRFLVSVFEEWVRRDVGTVFVQQFDAALASWVGAAPGVCVFAETCGAAVALGHNGDLYSCDHFVDPEHLLGNIATQHMADLVTSPAQRAFGDAKRDGLPGQCRTCRVRFACNGECPKNRISRTATGEDGLNHLCEGYYAFFTHIDGPMRVMAGLLGQGRPAADIMELFRRAGRNDPCPCGSGRKAKTCHQRPLTGTVVAPGGLGSQAAHGAGSAPGRRAPHGDPADPAAPGGTSARPEPSAPEGPVTVTAADGFR